MKILNLQRFSDIGGAERFYVDFLPGMIARGHEVHFLFVSRRRDRANVDKFAGELESKGVVTHVIEAERSVGIKMLRSLRHLLRSENFDLVQANLNHAEVWLALLDLLGWNNTPWISVKHGFSDTYQARYGFDPTKLRPGILSWGTRWAAKRADRVVAISKGLGDFLVAGRLVPAEKIEIIPYGFTFEIPESRAPRDTHRHGNRQLIMVGRLVPVKQQHLGIQIAAKLREEFSDLHMSIVGDGILMDQLRAQANLTAHPDMFHFEGFQTKVGEYLRDSDILLFPSKSEGFGLVILEAWNESVPVISFDVPACNEIIEDGIQGYIIPPFDVDAMAEKTAILLRDRALRRSFGNAGHQSYVTKYQLHTMLDRYVDLFGQIARPA